MQITDISDNETILSELVETMLNGQEVIICKAGKPVARLVPFIPSEKFRTPSQFDAFKRAWEQNFSEESDTLNISPRKLGIGQWKGKIWIADDFDDLPDDILKLFTGEAEETEEDESFT